MSPVNRAAWLLHDLLDTYAVVLPSGKILHVSTLASALQDAGLLVTEQDLEFRAMVEARKKRAEGRRAARQQAQL